MESQVVHVLVHKEIAQGIIQSLGRKEDPLAKENAGFESIQCQLKKPSCTWQVRTIEPFHIPPKTRRWRALYVWSGTKSGKSSKIGCVHESLWHHPRHKWCRGQALIHFSGTGWRIRVWIRAHRDLSHLQLAVDGNKGRRVRVRRAQYKGLCAPV